MHCNVVSGHICCFLFLPDMYDALLRVCSQSSRQDVLSFPLVDEFKLVLLLSNPVHQAPFATVGPPRFFPQVAIHSKALCPLRRFSGIS